VPLKPHANLSLPRRAHVQSIEAARALCICCWSNPVIHGIKALMPSAVQVAKLLGSHTVNGSAGAERINVDWILAAGPEIC
jgi:hypothetical protein